MTILVGDYAEERVLHVEHLQVRHRDESSSALHFCDSQSCKGELACAGFDHSVYFGELALRQMDRVKEGLTADDGLDGFYPACRDFQHSS